MQKNYDRTNSSIFYYRNDLFMVEHRCFAILVCINFFRSEKYHFLKREIRQKYSVQNFISLFIFRHIYQEHTKLFQLYLKKAADT